MASGMRRVAVIIGASDGIGAELARQLGATGRYSLVLAARREAELRAVAASCGCPAIAVQADATKKADVERVLTKALETYGQCDVFVNNVGRGIVRSPLELSDEDIDDMVTVNLKTAVWGTQVAVKYFLGQPSGGHVLNVSSMLAKVPMAPFRSMYSASKAAVDILSSNVRMELQASGAGDRVFLTTVHPGLVYTAFGANAMHVPSTAAGGSGAPTNRTPGGQEVADAVRPIVEAIEASAPSAVGPREVPAEMFTQGEVQYKQAVRYAQNVAEVEAEVGARLKAQAAATASASAGPSAAAAGK